MRLFKSLNQQIKSAHKSADRLEVTYKSWLNSLDPADRLDEIKAQQVFVKARIISERTLIEDHSKQGREYE